MKELGRRSRGPGRVYLTGGATAVLVGWRPSTVDVDLKMEPEPPGAFEAIAKLKNELDINVELASPDQFIPVPSDWSSQADFIERFGDVEFFHFDYRAQALSKLARGSERDVRDVRALLQHALTSREELRGALAAIEPQLVRYPGLDAEAFLARVNAFLEEPDG